MTTISGRLRALLCIVGILFGFGATVARAAATADASATAINQNELLERGAYLAKAADCGACHTVAQDKPFAGGLAIASPVGTIYSTNITPSMNFGIGRYSLAEFARALREGIRGDGVNLYPAMPYTSYSLLTDEDVRALYEFFMNSVVAVDERGPRTDLAFPLNIRWSMKAWNLIFLNKAQYQAAAAQNAEWNRGRYLVQALAHCGECHTPRGVLMQTKSGFDLAGAQVGPWYAPNITSDVTSGVGSWSTEDLARYLKTGVLIGKARAAGSMAEAVQDSFQYLTDADLRAMAIYVLSVPAIHDPVDKSSRFSIGVASSELGSLRGTSGIRADDGNPSGAQLFEANCASCHEALGQGTRDGYYPSLFDNSVVGARNPTNLIATILNGVNRTTAAGQAYMPGFGGRPHDLAALTDEQVALVGNYMADHFGRGEGQVTAKDVAQVRRGGPPSSLPTLARAGVALAAAGAIVLIGLLFFLVKRRDPKTTLPNGLR
jgi:mono/diheme cytochrome c family protein